jgi:hypothetical protein
MISAGGLFEAKKLGAQPPPPPPPKPHLRQQRRGRCPLRRRKPAGPRLGAPAGRAGIFFKYTGNWFANTTGMRTAKQRNAVLVFSICKNIVGHCSQSNLVFMENNIVNNIVHCFVSSCCYCLQWCVHCLKRRVIVRYFHVLFIIFCILYSNVLYKQCHCL